MFLTIKPNQTKTKQNKKFPIYRPNRTDWHLNWVQTNDLYKIELLEIELFDPLTVCKQMTDV